jgi:hypothetical protein
MNKRWLLLLVLILLALLAWLLYKRSSPTTLAGPLSDFAIADTAAVDRIFIADQKGITIDLRRNGDRWSVNGLPAKTHDVDLLLKAFKRVEVRSPVPKSEEATVLRIMASTARRVEIYQGDDVPEKVWIVGHGTKDHFGTYALLEKPGKGRSNAPFILGISGFIGILDPRFHTDMDSWRSSEVFHYTDLHDLASVELQFPAVPKESYRIENLGGDKVRMTDLQGNAQPFDTVLVRGALLPYQFLNYEYIERNLTDQQKDSLIGTTPSHILNVAERDGDQRTLKFWYMPGQGETSQWDPQMLHDRVRMHALIGDTLLVVVQREMFDRVLQPASSLRP